VVGGAGGIGAAWSAAMLEQYQAQIIWIGRRPLDADIQAKLDALAKGDAKLHYIQADASDEPDLQRAYQTIKTHYGQIHGVIHSAIVLQDQSLANMDETCFRASLSAKITASVRLAQVFRAESLDFMLFFSSAVVFEKVPGQSNYAAGSTFKDAYAHYLAKCWACPVKIINWGYWGSVGIVMDAVYQERMARVGLASIEPAEGMHALDVLLQGNFRQLALIKTLKPSV
ncbi:MAG: SDR family NAD(P)-dependent oxidoreductase, partial [Methylovulum sp.]|nr:SDR family NAD(P)-dependent oxidoreductase [Methylovulum sp.]